MYLNQQVVYRDIKKEFFMKSQFNLFFFKLPDLSLDKDGKEKVYLAEQKLKAKIKWALLGNATRTQLLYDYIQQTIVTSPKQYSKGWYFKYSRLDEILQVYNKSPCLIYEDLKDAECFYECCYNLEQQKYVFQKRQHQQQPATSALQNICMLN